MKHILKTTAAVAALAVGTLAAQADDIAQETRDVGAFDEVYLKGSMDVEIKVGGEQSVRVEADANIIDHIETIVKGDELHIQLERGNYRSIKRMKIYITVPSLDAAGVHGSGDMLVEGAEADDFDLNVHGSGDAIFKNAKLGKLDLSVHGSGDIKISGTCEEVEADLHGSGDIDADKMVCKTAEVSLQGSGDVSVHASDSANISVQGSGDVVVYGKPDKLRSKVQGSGDIEVR